MFQKLAYFSFLLFVFTTSATPQYLSQYAEFGKSFVLAGGMLADDNHEVWNQIVKMAGGKSKAHIGIISSASDTPEESYKAYREIFLHHGAAKVSLIPVTIHQTRNNSNPDVVKLIRTMTGFFFSGGDQIRIIQSFFISGHSPSPAMIAIAEQNKLGAVVSGSSAGTTCQTSSVMIEGGDSYDALKYGSDTRSSSRGVFYNAEGGTGLFPDFLLDTHFGNRGREGRMIRLLTDTKHLKHGTDRGIGVDENTALVVTHAENSDMMKGEIIGELGVTFIDVSKSYKGSSSRDFSIRGVLVSYLSKGDTIKLNSMHVTFSPDKIPIHGKENYDHALTSEEIFDGERTKGRKAEFLRVAASVIDSRLDDYSWGKTYHTHPQFKVTMSKTGKDCIGAVERRSGFHSDIHSYTNMYVEISVV